MVRLLIARKFPNLCGDAATVRAVLRRISMQTGCRRFNRFHNILHYRQNFVFNVNELGSLLGDIRICRGDSGKRFAEIKHLIRRKDATAALHICLRDNRTNARKFLRLARINTKNVGMRMLATNDFAVEHSRRVDIRTVLRGARYLFDGIDPRHFLADNSII